MSSKNEAKKVADKETNDDSTDTLYLDTTLRPSKWDDYIGQESIKKNLQILLQAAEERKHPPEHILFYGPPGLGKTTLAHLVAKEMNTQMKVTSGPAIEKVGDLASILTNLSSGDILFIDEIHRLNKNIEEILYPAMESGSLDIIIGKGPMISSPLRSRFSGGIFKLEFYTQEEIQKIIHRSASILGVNIHPSGSEEISKRSRYTPRTANYFLKRARDFAQVKKTDLTRESVNETLSMLGVDAMGLTSADRDILQTIIGKFSGGPVGINTIASAMSEEIATIEEFNEPYLIQIGFIDRTPRGRIATEHAYRHLGLTPPTLL